ncbi:MAG TPA: asparagine synthase C-terminal domain-containing protein [Methanospirillum sp.]|nr:asparagine synthase C-terminal domain-containing protein [Methanospirillum sp.]
MQLKGWVELNGQVLSIQKIQNIIADHPEQISGFGGEFYLESGSWRVRDKYGIIPGQIPAGSIWKGDQQIGTVNPDIVPQDLESAIVQAIKLRSDEGVTALSGGVDSALVAVLAQCPCIAVGMAGSHDVRRASIVAEETGLSLEIRVVTSAEIEHALIDVVRLLPDPTPVDIAIASTLYFVSETAHELGYERILTGQGADEIFGGYSRYLDKSGEDLERTFTDDFESLSRQGYRDQTIAGYHGAYLSMPYLDPGVVCAASRIPPNERVCGGVRKRPLREVAGRYLSLETASYEKKAMQYGTGIWKEIKRLARQNGYQNSVSDYIHNIRRV